MKDSIAHKNNYTTKNTNPICLSFSCIFFPQQGNADSYTAILDYFVFTSVKNNTSYYQYNTFNVAFFHIHIGTDTKQAHLFEAVFWLQGKCKSAFHLFDSFLVFTKLWEIYLDQLAV